MIWQNLKSYLLNEYNIFEIYMYMAHSRSTICSHINQNIIRKILDKLYKIGTVLVDVNNKEIK